jgi:hypothetical protein
MTCNFFGFYGNEGVMFRDFEDKLDVIYEKVFDMGKMDIKGFRRLRTIS